MKNTEDFKIDYKKHPEHLGTIVFVSKQYKNQWCEIAYFIKDEEKNKKSIKTLINHMKNSIELEIYKKEQKRKLSERMKKIGKLGGLASKKNGTDYRKLALKRWKKLSPTK